MANHMLKWLCDHCMREIDAESREIIEELETVWTEESIREFTPHLHLIGFDICMRCRNTPDQHVKMFRVKEIIRTANAVRV